MIDVWLLIVMIATPCILTVANIYLLIYFIHPNDKNTAWAPKIVTVFSPIRLLVVRVSSFSYVTFSLEQKIRSSFPPFFLAFHAFLKSSLNILTFLHPFPFSSFIILSSLRCSSARSLCSCFPSTSQTKTTTVMCRWWSYG